MVSVLSKAGRSRCLEAMVALYRRSFVGRLGAAWVGLAFGLLLASGAQAQQLSWTEMGGAGYDIGVGADGTVWVTGGPPTRAIYRWNGGTWAQIPGEADRVAVDPKGNAIISVISNDAKGGHYLWTGSAWQKLVLKGITTGTKDIGVGANGGIYGIINGRGKVIFSGATVFGYLPATSRGAEQVPTRVSVGPQGKAWIIGSPGGQIYGQGAGSHWQLMGNENLGALDVAACHNGDVYMIGRDNNPYRWKVDAWEGLTGPAGLALLSIACDAQGVLYATTTSKRIFKAVFTAAPPLAPITLALPTATQAQCIDGPEGFEVGLKQNLRFESKRAPVFEMYQDMPIGFDEDYLHQQAARSPNRIQCITKDWLLYTSVIGAIERLGYESMLTEAQIRNIPPYARRGNPRILKIVDTVREMPITPVSTLRYAVARNAAPVAAVPKPTPGAGTAPGAGVPNAPVAVTRKATPAALSRADFKLLAKWIADDTSANRQPYCWKESYGRGAGKSPLEVGQTCASDRQIEVGMCYKKPDPGYRCTLTGCMNHDCSGLYGKNFESDPLTCRQPLMVIPKPMASGWCPSGFDNMGLYCYKWWTPDSANKSCPSGFSLSGGLCHGSCPAGFENDGLLCRQPLIVKSKPYYDRGIGNAPGCPANYDDNGASLCYDKCKDGYSGVVANLQGPVCWSSCPAGKSTCGAGCSDGTRACVENTLAMVLAPLELAANLVSAGGAGKSLKVTMDAVSAATKNGLKVYDATTKLQGAIGIAEGAMGAMENWLNDYVTAFADYTSEEVQNQIDMRFGKEGAEWVKKQYGLVHFAMMMKQNGQDTLMNAFSVAAMVDPSGVLGVVEAFAKPMCKKNAFPAIRVLHNN